VDRSGFGKADQAVSEVWSRHVTRSTVASMGPAQPGEKPGGDGRIPFTFRIGVTGHRDLADPDSFFGPIDEALRRLKELVPASPGVGLVPVVVSALAEGADRLVAKEVLADKDARLEVALPLPKEEYAKDFKSEASKEEFCCLLARASETPWQAPRGLDRDEAYERAGRYVVDRCDALIALWDGKKSRGRGGTAEIVGYAQEHGVPIAWVHTEGDLVVDYALENSRADVVKSAAAKLCEYNAGMIEPAEFDQHARALRKELMPDMATEIPIDPLGLSRETVASWVFPYFIRADILALRYQRRFRWLSWAIFALAAAAVAVVAMQANFWPGLNWLAVLEVLCLGGLLLILVMNRRWRLHDQWISSRFLAERLRSSYFLALAGTGDRRRRSARLAYLSDSSEAWIERALTEVSARRPQLDDGPPPVGALRDYLNRSWIESQIIYQEKASGRQGTFDSRLVRATVLLFLLTLVAACIHSFGSLIFRKGGIHEAESPGFWEELLVVVAITVPAVGAALHGIGTQRQSRRHSERYRRMAGVLAQVQREMAKATTLEQVRKVAAETEQIMREENSDWFGVMRFHDMELIT
jgi:hypothetical protein